MLGVQAEEELEEEAEAEAEAGDCYADWGRQGPPQPGQASHVGSREATPPGNSAYPGARAADEDWQQYEDGDEEDDADDADDEDYV